MAHAELEMTQTHRFGPHFGATVQNDERLTGSSSTDLNFPPADARPTCSEDLHHRFFGGKTRCRSGDHMFGRARYIGDLFLGENAAEEFISETLVRFSDSGGGANVGADSKGGQ